MLLEVPPIITQIFIVVMLYVFMKYQFNKKNRSK